MLVSYKQKQEHSNRCVSAHTHLCSVSTDQSSAAASPPLRGSNLLTSICSVSLVGDGTSTKQPRTLWLLLKWEKSKGWMGVVVKGVDGGSGGGGWWLVPSDTNPLWQPNYIFHFSTLTLSLHRAGRYGRTGGVDPRKNPPPPPPPPHPSLQFHISV